MNTLICAGGSSARVLEAVLHLCAAGMGPDELRILKIEPDTGNGNAANAQALLSLYEKCRARFTGKASGQKVDHGLFRTRLDLFDTDSGPKGLKNWTPVTAGQTLRDVVNYDHLSSNAQNVVRLLFSQAELDMKLGEGFRGHTAVGAAALALVTRDADKMPWKQLLEKLQTDLSQPKGARVCIVGSVFGGTGASTFYPLARFLKGFKDPNIQRLRIGAVAMTPYFRFESATSDAPTDAQEMAAKAAGFPVATRAAAEFYHNMRSHGDWPFDAMFWMGDNSPMQVPYAPGGNLQRNPSHFVDLLAALASLEFFSQPLEGGGCRYSGPRQEEQSPLSNGNVLEWQDIPTQGPILKRLKFALLRFATLGTVHSEFLHETLGHESLDLRPHHIPWYYDHFVRKGDTLAPPDRQESLDALRQFFVTYHFPWWAQIHRLETARLFNRNAFSNNGSGQTSLDLARLKNILYSSKSGVHFPDSVDDFFNVLCAERAPEAKGEAGYLSLLHNATTTYLEKQVGLTRVEEA